MFLVIKVSDRFSVHKGRSKNPGRRCGYLKCIRFRDKIACCNMSIRELNISFSVTVDMMKYRGLVPHSPSLCTPSVFPGQGVHFWSPLRGNDEMPFRILVSPRYSSVHELTVWPDRIASDKFAWDCLYQASAKPAGVHTSR